MATHLFGDREKILERDQETQEISSSTTTTS